MQRSGHCRQEERDFATGSGQEAGPDHYFAAYPRFDRILVSWQVRPCYSLGSTESFPFAHPVGLVQPQ